MSSKVDEYFNKQTSPRKEICLRLRELLLRTFPGITEEIKWGVPTYAGGNYYIVALKDHVNLGFTIKGLTEEDVALFDGSGKTMRYIRLNRVDIDEDRIIKLLKLVDKKARE